MGMTLLSLFSLSGTSRVWAIEDYHNRVIGRISLRDIEQWWRRARLGISLNEVYLGQGLGTEALTLFFDYYFGSFNYATLLLDVAAFNGRAIRCYERLGFVLKGYDWRQTTNTSCIQLLKDPQYHDLREFFRQDEQGIWVQYLEMELHKRQWQERKPTKSGLHPFHSLQQ
jgi:RimJ/RimL family protein N-acetyltransferase